MYLKYIKHMVLTCMVSVFLIPLSAKAETTLLFNMLTPPSHFSWEVMQDWADQVNEKSEGRLVIEFAAKSVAPPPKIMDAVRKGAADAGWVANIFLGPDNPGALVGLMPWVHLGDSEATSVALWNTYQKFFADKEEWPGIEVLGMYHFAGASLCSMTDEHITSADDLRKRKVWSLPGNLAKILGNMDVSLVTGPAVQIHEMVSRNVVEAYTGITYDSIIKFKVAPYTKSCVEFEKAPFAINFTHFINAKTWARLSPEDQQVLRDLSGEHLARMVGKRVNQQLQEGRIELGKTAEYIPASEDLVASFTESAQPIIDEWLVKVAEMGVDGQAALDFMRSEVERLSTFKLN